MIITVEQETANETLAWIAALRQARETIPGDFKLLFISVCYVHRMMREPLFVYTFQLEDT